MKKFLSRSSLLLLGLALFMPISAISALSKQKKNTALTKKIIATAATGFAVYFYGPPMFHGTSAWLNGPARLDETINTLGKIRARLKAIKKEVNIARNVLIKSIKQEQARISESGSTIQSDYLSDSVVLLNESCFDAFSLKNQIINSLDKVHFPQLWSYKPSRYFGLVPEFIVNGCADIKRSCANWAWSFRDEKQILVTYGGVKFFKTCSQLLQSGQNALNSITSHKSVLQEIEKFVASAREIITLVKSLDNYFELREHNIKRFRGYFADVTKDEEVILVNT